MKRRVSQLPVAEYCGADLVAAALLSPFGL